jgi:hypothetical protein
MVRAVRRRAALVGWVVTLLLLACGGEQVTPVPEDDGSVSLKRDVFPIVEAAGCATAGTCHFAGNITAHFMNFETPGEFRLALVDVPGLDHCPLGTDQIVDVPMRGQIRVVPGDPDESSLMVRLSDPREDCAPFYARMPPPPRERLSEAAIETIRTWIAEGARAN